MLTRNQIIKIVKKWQDRLGLNDWVLRLHFDDEAPEEKDILRFDAETTPARCLDEAEISFYDWKDWDTVRCNQVVVHELLHCVHREVENVFELIEGQLHRDAQLVATKAFDNHVEQFVDRLARILMELDNNVATTKTRVSAKR